MLGVAALPAIAFGVDAYRTRAAREACEDAGRAIHDTLPERERLRAAMLASGAANAADTADKVLPLLDAHAQRWQDARTEVCIAADVRESPGWDADMLDRAVWCLDERRLELVALAEQFGRGSPDAVMHAVEAASTLEPVDPCTDANGLARLPAPPQSDREDIEAARAELSHAAALRVTGAYAEAVDASRAVVARAETLGWPPLHAHARVGLGYALTLDGRWEQAVTELEEAYFEAAAAGVAGVAASAAILLVDVYGNRLYRGDEALQWARHAEVALVSVPDPMRMHEADLHRAVANAHVRAGALELADAPFERALALREEALGSDHVLVAAVIGDLAMVRSLRGAHHEAKLLFERALAIEEQAYGPRHPSVATTLSNLAVALGWIGSIDEARRAHERALEIRIETLGPEHPYVASSLSNLGALEASIGELERARTRLERSLQIRERVLPRGHPEILEALSNLGMIATSLGDNDRAEELLEYALALQIATHGPEHMEVAQALGRLGDLARRTDALADARSFYAEALAIGSKTFGRDHPEMVPSLLGLTDLAIAERPREAVATAERALAVQERHGASPADVALASFMLARALVAADGVTDRVRVLVERARDGLREGSPEAVAFEAWAAKHDLQAASERRAAPLPESTRVESPNSWIE